MVGGGGGGSAVWAGGGGAVVGAVASGAVVGGPGSATAVGRFSELCGRRMTWAFSPWASRWPICAAQRLIECVEERVRTLFREGTCEVVKIQSPHHPSAMTLLLQPVHLRKGAHNTARCRYNAVIFLQYSHNRHHYGVSVVSLKSDLCSVAVITVSDVISW